MSHKFRINTTDTNYLFNIPIRTFLLYSTNFNKSFVISVAISIPQGGVQISS